MPENIFISPDGQNGILDIPKIGNVSGNSLEAICFQESHYA